MKRNSLFVILAVFVVLFVGCSSKEKSFDVIRKDILQLSYTTPNYVHVRNVPSDKIEKFADTFAFVLGQQLGADTKYKGNTKKKIKFEVIRADKVVQTVTMTYILFGSYTMESTDINILKVFEDIDVPKVDDPNKKLYLKLS